MFEYTEILLLADEILGILSTGIRRQRTEDIKRSLRIDYQPNDIIIAIEKLITDNYIKKDGEFVIILNEGLQLSRIGGYSKRIEQEKLLNEIKSKIDQSILITNNSVVDTNESVKTTNSVLKRNIELNEKLYWLTLFVALVSTFATVKSCQISAEESKQSKLIEAKDSLILQIQKRLLQTENDVHHLKEENDSLKKIVDSSHIAK